MSSPSTPERSAPPDLAALARDVRLKVIETVAASGAGHIGGPLSATDLLVHLYFERLNIDPARPDSPDRDRFILSKGHCAIALYAVLALRGYFPIEELSTFDHGDSRLQGHPDANLTPGVDASTGSLGQGLSVGVGIAMAAKRLGKDFHTWVMVGDGEIEEGMVWEAVISTPRYGLDNLSLIVDLNGLQQYGWPAREGDRFDRSEPMGHIDLAAVFEGFGWHVIEIDGHDYDQIRKGCGEAEAGRGRRGRPSVLLARTTKGHGISFTQGTYRWHNGVATNEQLSTARAELASSGQPR